MFLISD